MFLRGHLWVSYQGIFFSSFPTYKNQTFTNPDPDEPVSDASLLQDKPQPVMFAPQGKDEHRGIFLVNLHSPLNSGTAGINAKYNELVSWFTAGCRRIRTDRGALHFLHILLLPQSYHRRFSPPRPGAISPCFRCPTARPGPVSIEPDLCRIARRVSYRAYILECSGFETLKKGLLDFNNPLKFMAERGEIQF